MLFMKKHNQNTFAQRLEIIEDNFNFCNPIIILQNYVSDLVLKDGYNFNCQNENVLELYNKNIKKMIKRIIKTIIETNVKNGSCYVYFDELLNPNLINPTYDFQVWKTGAEIDKVQFTYSTGQQGHTDAKTTIIVDRKAVYTTDGKLLRTHNLGFCPVVEFMLKKSYMFSSWALPNFCLPYQFLNTDNNTFASYTFDSVYKPLFAPAGSFHKVFNTVYQQFFKTIEFSIPKSVITGASANLSAEFQKDSETNKFNFTNENITFVRGEDTKVQFIQPNTKLNEFSDTIIDLFKQWFTMMGLVFQYESTGNNKTQAEVENKDSLQFQTIHAIIDSLESSVEHFIDMYAKIYTLNKNKEINTPADIDAVEFKWSINSEVDGKTADALIKLVQEQIISIPESRSLLYGTSLDWEKEQYNEKILGQMKEQEQAETEPNEGVESND